MRAETSQVDGPATQAERLENHTDSRTDDGPGNIERRVGDRGQTWKKYGQSGLLAWGLKWIGSRSGRGGWGGHRR